MGDILSERVQVDIFFSGIPEPKIGYLSERVQVENLFLKSQSQSWVTFFPSVSRLTFFFLESQSQQRESWVLICLESSDTGHSCLFFVHLLLINYTPCRQDIKSHCPSKQAAQLNILYSLKDRRQEMLLDLASNASFQPNTGESVG